MSRPARVESRPPWGRRLGLVAALVVAVGCGLMTLGGLWLRNRTVARIRQALATPGVGPLSLASTPEPTPVPGAATQDPTAQAYLHALATISALEGLATESAAARAAIGSTASPPASPPDQLALLATYLQKIRPNLDRGLEAARRDGEVLESAQADPSMLCPGGSLNPVLAADATLMRRIELDLRKVGVPAAASQTVHAPLVSSAEHWAKALEDLRAACGAANEVERNLRQLSAGTLLARAAQSFRAAVESYWALAVSTGLESFGAARP